MIGLFFFLVHEGKLFRNVGPQYSKPDLFRLFVYAGLGMAKLPFTDDLVLWLSVSSPVVSTCQRDLLDRYHLDIYKTQSINLFIFRFVFQHCLRSTRRLERPSWRLSINGDLLLFPTTSYLQLANNIGMIAWKTKSKHYLLKINIKTNLPILFPFRN